MRPQQVLIPLALGGWLLTSVAGGADSRVDGLDRAVEASWVRLPIREWAARATDLAGRPVIIDRRIDPERLVSLTARGETLREVLDRVAGSVGGRIDALTGSIRIVPEALAGQAAQADREARASLARLPGRARAALSKRRAWEWPDGARPSDLVAAAAAEAGLQLEGLDLLPHDHFPAARLPPLSLAERLDLVLAHFDRRVAWTVEGGRPVGRIVPISDGLDPESPAATARRPRAAAAATPRPGRRSSAGREVFSLRLEAPLDQALTAIAERLGLEFSIEEESLRARGIAPGEIVRASVEDASRDELLDAVLGPLELAWQIDAGRLRVFAPLPPSAPPTPAAVAAAVAARQLLPSVHADRAELRAALVAAEVPPATVEGLFAAADRAILPGMVPSLDGFLFFTRDPAWLPLRNRFAEYLSLPGVTAMDPQLTAALADFAGVVTLPDMTAVSVESAEALAAFGGADWAAAVEFPGVTSLEPDAAAAIARCPALLVFPGLQRLSADSAKALARHEGVGIVLGGLKALPPDVAAALAEVTSLQGLLLPDLTSLDSAALAGRLARQDHAFLPAVTRIDPAIAAALRGSDGGELALPGLATLPPEIARKLVGGGYFWLVFGCGQNLSKEAAEILARHPGQLTFTGPEPLPPEAARGLAAHTGTLRLPQVAAITPDLATALGQHRGPLVLDGIATLDGPDATGIAGSLATAPGIVALPGLKRISASALRRLLEKSDVQLPPIEGLEVIGPGGGHHEDVVAPDR